MGIVSISCRTGLNGWRYVHEIIYLFPVDISEYWELCVCVVARLVPASWIDEIERRLILARELKAGCYRWSGVINYNIIINILFQSNYWYILKITFEWIIILQSVPCAYSINFLLLPGIEWLIPMFPQLQRITPQTHRDIVCMYWYAILIDSVVITLAVVIFSFH